MSLRESYRKTLLAATTITTAVAAGLSDVVIGLPGMRSLVVQAKFVYGSGGTNVTAYVQTSLDGGASWIDILCFQFTTSSGVKVFAVVDNPATPIGYSITPSDGSLTANTVVTGILGDRLRVKYVTTGTYGGATTLAVDLCAKG